MSEPNHVLSDRTESQFFSQSELKINRNKYILHIHIQDM